VIYVDANVVIRLVEGTPAARTNLEARLAASRGVAGSILTSLLTRLECRVMPLRTGDRALLALYDGFFTEPEMAVHEITPAVIDKATELRAAHRFKTPDALHLATAILAGATAFLTGDRGLLRCAEVPVEVL
jgi:predicted nucleic acid-binding protein